MHNNINELFEELVVPNAEIDTVLQWLKAEQVRILTRDRIHFIRDTDKVDWITDLHSSLRTLKSSANAEQNYIDAHNRDVLKRREQEN